MPKKKETAAPAAVLAKPACCAVEALVTVDERGQMVLPKDLRERAGIKAGDKLAVTTWERNGEICCLALIKAGNLESMVKNILGPVMGEILNK